MADREEYYDSDCEGADVEDFEPWDPQYRCCCSSVHVKQGSLMVGIVSGVLIFYSVVTIPIAVHGTSFWKASQIALLLLDFITVICLFRGIRVESHKLLLPYLIYSSHTAVLLFVGTLIGFYNFWNPQTESGYLLLDIMFEKNNTDFRAVQIAGLFVALSCLIALVLTIWWTSVVWKCFLYLRTFNQKRTAFEKREQEKYLAKNYF